MAKGSALRSAHSCPLSVADPRRFVSSFNLVRPFDATPGRKFFRSFFIADIINYFRSSRAGN